VAGRDALVAQPHDSYPAARPQLAPLSTGRRSDPRRSTIPTDAESMSTASTAFTASQPPQLRVASPSELFEAIPYLLGFHPRSSLVLVGLRRGQLIVTARIDLADADLARPSPSTGLLTHTLTAVARGGAETLIAVAYLEPHDDDFDSPRWARLAAAIGTASASLGCPAHDTLFVRAERWRSPMCAVRECCGPSGHRLDPRLTHVSAAATYAGLVARPDRAALSALFEPTEAGRERLDRLVRSEIAREATTDQALKSRRLAVKRALFAAARVADIDGPWSSPNDAAAARFAAGLHEVALRDRIWIAIDDRRLDGRRLWLDLARRLSAPYDAAPLFLYGWASWRAGDGAVAGIAAERALSSDPAYSAADLLLAALSQGVNPHRLPRLRRTRPG
jgi:hypothetical protein